MSYYCSYRAYFCFFFNDTATTEIYTLSLHDALPISDDVARCPARAEALFGQRLADSPAPPPEYRSRSEEHTSELQSLTNLVCRLLLEKKKNLKPRNNLLATAGIPKVTDLLSAKRLAV